MNNNRGITVSTSKRGSNFTKITDVQSWFIKDEINGITTNGYSIYATRNSKEISISISHEALLEMLSEVEDYISGEIESHISIEETQKREKAMRNTGTETEPTGCKCVNCSCRHDGD